MTTPDRHQSDDEIVSAVLDGEATPEEVARVEADPALRARLAAFRAAAASVAAPVVAPDDADRDAAVAAALAAAEEPAHTEPADAGLDELAARRAGRSPGRAGPWLAAAAVLAVLVGLGALLVDRSGDTSFETAGRSVEATDEQTTADEAPDVAAGAPAPDEQAALDTGARAAPTTTAPPAAPEAGFGTDAAEANRSTGAVPLLDPVGDLADDEAVARWARGSREIGWGTYIPDVGQIDGPVEAVPPCPSTAGGAVALAPASYAGREVQLVVVDPDPVEGGMGAGALIVEVVDPTTCEVLSVVEVPAG